MSAPDSSDTAVEPAEACVGDRRLFKSRLLAEQCSTCIFRPGNLMRLADGGLKQLVTEAKANGSYVICHETLPDVSPPPGVEAAICRGFADRYDTASLQVMRRLWGFVEVPPPDSSSTHTPPEPVPDTEPGERDALPCHAPDADTASPIGSRVDQHRRPLVFIDVDGVLSPDLALTTPTALRTAGYVPHDYDGPAPDGQNVAGQVWLHPSHGDWLTEIAATGAEMVWATSWRHLAAAWISSRLGLPTDWPHLDVTGGGIRWGYAVKLAAVREYAAGRPFALLDDVIGPRDFRWAVDRSRSIAPTLLHRVHPVAGLSRGDVDQVLSWLNQLPVIPDRHGPA